MQVTFTISTAGPHEITVLAGSCPVAGSPFRVEVSPGPVAASSCRLYGPGLSAVQLGRDMRMFVQLADAFGNTITDPNRLQGSNVKVHTDSRRRSGFSRMMCLKQIAHHAPAKCPANAANT